jgi:hypothetical protein
LSFGFGPYWLLLKGSPFWPFTDILRKFLRSLTRKV